MLVEALVTLAAAPGWVIGGELPTGYQLLVAEQNADGSQLTRYGRPTRDPDDAPLVLTAYPSGRFTPPFVADTTVHGQAAAYGELTDDGQTYGRELRWNESSGETLTVGLDGEPTDAALRALAESVVAVPPERWQALVTATMSPPERPPSGSKAVAVRRGQAGGRRWTLTALLPPGFPVAPEDRRAACLRVTFRGAHSTECDELAAWRRVGGTVFVYGVVPARVKRVRVNRVTARTGAAAGYPLARFYAVALPTGTCEVRVFDADRNTFLTPSGPAAGGPQADRRRCLRTRADGPPSGR